MSKSTVGVAPDREKLLEWVMCEIDFYGRYHNHKETMAWTATAFYIPGIIALAYGAAKMDILTCCWHYLIAFLIIVVFAVLACCFVRMQFENRWKAHYTVVGLMRVAAEFCRKESSKKCDFEIEKDKRWPQFIEEEIEKAETSKANLVESEKKSLEWGSYAAIILATLIALALPCVLIGASPS